MVRPFLRELSEDVDLVGNLVGVDGGLGDVLFAVFNTSFLWDHGCLVELLPTLLEVLPENLLEGGSVLLDELKPYPLGRVFEEVHGLCLDGGVLLVVEEFDNLAVVRLQVVDLLGAVGRQQLGQYLEVGGRVLGVLALQSFQDQPFQHVDTTSTLEVHLDQLRGHRLHDGFRTAERVLDYQLHFLLAGVDPAREHQLSVARDDLLQTARVCLLQ